MLTIKTQVRKTKTTTGVAVVEFDGATVGTVTTGPGKGASFEGLDNDGESLGNFVTRAAATHAVWRASTGKAKSKRGGNQRGGANYMTRTEAAVALGVSKSTLARRIKSAAVTETSQGVRV